MVRFASEIVQKAELMGQIHNTDALEWKDKIDFLNQVYVDLYNDLHRFGDRYFEKELHINPEDISIQKVDSIVSIELPHDFYLLTFVGYKNTMGEDVPIMRAPSATQFYTGYRMVRNELQYRAADISGPLVVRYIPKPLTITFPAKPVKNETFSGGIDIFQNSSFAPYMYGTVAYDPTEQAINWTDEFGNTSPLFFLDDGTGRTIAPLAGGSIMVIDPYIYINLSRGANHQWVHGIVACWNHFEFNPLQRDGRNHNIYVTGGEVNDSTGYGINYMIDGVQVNSGFTPDTAMDYPSNTFFDYMIVKLAIIMNSSLQQPINHLIEIGAAYRDSFEKFLSRDNYQPARVNNVYSHKQGWGF